MGATRAGEGGQYAKYVWRPFSKKWLFCDRILNHRVYPWPSIPSGTKVTELLHTGRALFSALMTNGIPSEGLGGALGENHVAAHGSS